MVAGAAVGAPNNEVDGAGAAGVDPNNPPPPAVAVVGAGAGVVEPKRPPPDGAGAFFVRWCGYNELTLILEIKDVINN